VPAIGESFARYVVEREIGEGGMGHVFRARDTVLNRRVALKVLRVPKNDGEAKSRLLREAQVAAALDHPNAVKVYDVGEHKGIPFLAMELVEGETLRAKLAHGAPPASFLRWLAEVASALGAAHDLGILHRDVKPENVIVRSDGVAKVLDFGIARRMTSDIDPNGPTVDSDEFRTLTEAGALVGTPAYIAPEQLRGEPQDGRADQFAWGVVAYECMVGESPWGETANLVAVIAAIAGKEVTALPKRVSRAVEAVVVRALSKDPEKRFPTMHALEAALRAAASEPEISVAASPDSTLSTRRVVTGERLRTVYLAVGTLVLSAAAVITSVKLAKTHHRPPAPAAAERSIVPEGGVRAPEVPPGTDPEAARLYRAGCEAQRRGTDTVAAMRWKEALDRDAGLAAAKLRYALSWATDYGDSDKVRAAYRAARDQRERLSPRDRELVTAIAPLFDDPANPAGAAAALGALSDARPDDAEVAAWRGELLLNIVGDAASALSAFDESLRRDPGNVWAVATGALALSHLGRRDEARVRAERCVKDHPQAGICHRWLLDDDERAGRCSDEESRAHAWIRADPTDYYPPWYLAAVLAWRRAPKEAVEEAIRQAREVAPVADPIDSFSRIDVPLAVWEGDFVRALAAARDSDARLTRQSAVVEEREAAAWRIADVQLETGDTAGARATARAALHRAEAESSFGVAAFNQGVPGRALACLVRDDERERWLAVEKATDARLAQARALPLDMREELWNAAFGECVETRADAERGIEAARELGMLDSNRALDSDFALGRALAAVGNRDEATRLLRRFLARCDGLTRPRDRMRAHVELGNLRRDAGDVTEAASLYSVVVATWGDAKPRSVTLEAARRALAALRRPGR